MSFSNDELSEIVLEELDSEIRILSIDDAIEVCELVEYGAKVRADAMREEHGR